MREIIEKVNFIGEYINTDYHSSFEFTPAEHTYRERQLRCVAKHDLKSGTIITKDLILLKLIDDQVDTFNNVSNLVGKVLLNDVALDSVIKIQNVK